MDHVSYNKESQILVRPNENITDNVFQVNSNSFDDSDKLFLEESQECKQNDGLEVESNSSKNISDINNSDLTQIKTSQHVHTPLEIDDLTETRTEDLELPSSSHVNEISQNVLNSAVSNNPAQTSLLKNQSLNNPENSVQQIDEIMNIKKDLQYPQISISNEGSSEIKNDNCDLSNDNVSVNTSSSDLCRTFSIEAYASSSSVASTISAGSSVSNLNLVNSSPKNDNRVTSSESICMNNNNNALEMDDANMNNEVDRNSHDTSDSSSRKRKITSSSAAEMSNKIKRYPENTLDFQDNDYYNTSTDREIPASLQPEVENSSDSKIKLNGNNNNEVTAFLNLSANYSFSDRPSLTRDDPDMVNCSDGNTSELQNKPDSIFLNTPEVISEITSPDIIPTFELVSKLDEHNDIVSLTIVRTDRKYSDYNADWSQNSSPGSVTSTGVYQLVDQKRYSTISSSTTSSECSTKKVDNFAIPAIPLKKSTIHKQDIKGHKELFTFVKDIFKIALNNASFDEMNLSTEKLYDKDLTSNTKQSEAIQNSIKDSPISLVQNSDNVYEVINSPELLNDENITDSSTNGLLMTPKTRQVRKSVRSITASPHMKVIKEDLFEVDPRTMCRVLARWVDKKYYAGRIIQVKDSNKFVIRFDDNHTKTLTDEYVIFGEQDVLPLQGQSVYVSLKGDSEYEPGMVTSITTNKGDVFYTVETDNSVISSAKASDFYLTEDQARAIKEIQVAEPEVENTSKRGIDRDLSLDNIIQGPRSRRQVNAKPVTPKAGSSGLNKKRYTGRNKQRHISESSDKSVTEPASPASTTENEESVGKAPIEEVQGVEPEVQKTPKKIPGAITGPFPVKGCGRLSGRRTSKVVGSLYDNSDPETVELLGPIPASKLLFNKRHFLLTCSEDVPHSIKLARLASYDANSGTDSEHSTDAENCNVPFAKERLKCQLEAGGGIVYSHFEEVPQNKYSRCILIAPRACHTAKYIQCLATNIKAVLHSWVIDCCKTNKLLSEYYLPAGWSLERKCYIRYNIGKELYMRLSSNPFSGFSVLLCSDNTNFLKFWGRVCKSAGAKIRTIDNDEVDVSDSSVIVTDSDCPLKIRKQAQSLEIPLVSTTWVVQSLIIGQVCNYDNNIKYAYNYVDTD